MKSYYVLKNDIIIHIKYRMKITFVILKMNNIESLAVGISFLKRTTQLSGDIISGAGQTLFV